MPRLFVAIPLPDEVKDELRRVQKELRRLDLIEGNFIRKENLHLTLHFLGHLEEHLIPEIDHILKELSTKPLTICLNELGIFKKGSHISVIWASVMSDELQNLAHLIKIALNAFVPDDRRPYRAHLTLVRVKRVHRPAHFLEALRRLALKPIIFKPKQFVLMTSTLSHEGSIYEISGSYELDIGQKVIKN